MNDAYWATDRQAQIDRVCDADLHTWIAAIMNDPAGLRADITVEDVEGWAYEASKHEPQTMSLLEAIQ